MGVCVNRFVPILSFAVANQNFLHVHNHAIISREAEKSLLDDVSCGNISAREILMTYNQRLVAKLAYKHKSQRVDIEDLVQQGNIGLLEAIDRFDTKRKGRLSTYATFYIRKHMLAHKEKMSYTIRVPKYMQYRRRSVRATMSRLYDELCRDPTDDEVAGELGISCLQVRRAMSVPFASSLDDVKEVL